MIFLDRFQVGLLVSIAFFAGVCITIAIGSMQ
jgi:hypothetical protein